MRLLPIVISSIVCLQSSLYAHFFEKPRNNAEKFYVNPENITLSGNGIYLKLRDGQSIPVRSIQADDSGLFVALDKQEETNYTTYICPGCGGIYYWWENCNTPGCPG